jgi:hypothetical protein
MEKPTTTEDEPEAYDDDWSRLPWLMKFAVLFAALVFLGVVIEGLLLTPWTLVLHGWIPAPNDAGISAPHIPVPPGQPGSPGRPQP